MANDSNQNESEYVYVLYFRKFVSGVFYDTQLFLIYKQEEDANAHRDSINNNPTLDGTSRALVRREKVQRKFPPNYEE